MQIPPEEITDLHGANENSPRRPEIKVRKNEMKLRKKQIKLPKNFFMPPWRISIFYRGNFDFLGGVVPGSSECVKVPRTNNDLFGRTGRVTVGVDTFWEMSHFFSIFAVYMLTK